MMSAGNRVALFANMLQPGGGGVGSTATCGGPISAPAAPLSLKAANACGTMN